MSKFHFSISILAFLICFSCTEKKEDTEKIISKEYKRVYEDSFEGDTIKPFWKTQQISHPDRLKLVKDPLDSKNNVMKISIEPGDIVAGGYRNELMFRSYDSLGYLTKYSYRFMLPDSFFKKEEKAGSIVLNQWHDDPYPGFTWATKKIKVRPPFAMYVEHTLEGEFYMKLHCGVKMGNVNEMTISKWPDKLEPNKWYTLQTEIFWSIYEDGYVKTSINDTCFQLEGVPQCKNSGTNMYHKIPNYYKMGLYWSKGHTNNRHIYYDDFKMVTKRIGYLPPKIEIDSLQTGKH